MTGSAPICICPHALDGGPNIGVAYGCPTHDPRPAHMQTPDLSSVPVTRTGFDALFERVRVLEAVVVHLRNTQREMNESMDRVLMRMPKL